MLHSADFHKETDATAKGADGRQSRSRWCQPLRREVRKRVLKETRQQAPEWPVISLISLGRTELSFVPRPLPVFSPAIILLAATASSSLAQKRTPLQTI